MHPCGQAFRPGQQRRLDLAEGVSALHSWFPGGAGQASGKPPAGDSHRSISSRGKVHGGADSPQRRRSCEWRGDRRLHTPLHHPARGQGQAFSVAVDDSIGIREITDELLFMKIEQSFLCDIIAHPDDDTPLSRLRRLVGGARRPCACRVYPRPTELAHCGGKTLEATPSWSESESSLRRIAPTGSNPSGGSGGEQRSLCSVRLHRECVAQWRSTRQAWRATVQAPIRRLYLRSLGDHTAALGQMTFLCHLRELHLEFNVGGDELARVLADTCISQVFASSVSWIATSATTGESSPDRPT